MDFKEEFHMETEIYYFSGTGNSFFVAKELQKRIPDSAIIPIVSLLDENIIKTNAKTVGIVFPVHALSIPLAVRRFLKKLELTSPDYVFTIATRLGIIFNGFSLAEKLLKKKKVPLNSHFIVNMYSNDVCDEHYKIPSKDDILKIEISLQKQLESIQRIVLNREIYLEKDDNYIIDHPYNRLGNYLLEKLVVSLLSFSEYIGGVNYFCSDSNCNSCGVCEKVCLSKKIKLTDKKPVWQKNVLCYMCYACINYCPQQSVQINDIPGKKSYTRQTGRYSHPYANISDISNQK
jgi:ferredoxin